MNENEKSFLFLACVCGRMWTAREEIKLNAKTDKILYVKRFLVDEGMTTSDSGQ